MPRRSLALGAGSAGRRAVRTPNTIAADVRAWYDAYLTAFTSLARGERADLDTLLGFYGVPLLFVVGGRVQALATSDEVRQSARALTDRLRAAGYAGSTVHRLDVRPLDTRTAVIEGVFSRLDRAGAEVERLGAAYLVVRTEVGWRFAAIALTEPPA
jgi:hypothetical protein